MASDSGITTLLRQWRNGDEGAGNRLFPLVYAQLSDIAHSHRRRAWALDTLDTTALVHEAYLKLIDQAQSGWENRAHFMAVASTAMRQIVINYVKRKRSQKQGGDWHRVTYDESRAAAVARAESLLIIEQAMTKLEELDPRLARIVEYRFFGGMTEVEIGCVLGVTERTVRREWNKAKAFLARALSSEDGDSHDHVSVLEG